MFESLQERLGAILNGLTGRGALSEADVSAALREVRRALLEADVALDVVRSFTDKVRAKAVGAAVLKSIKPGQMVVKIVHDELVAMLGNEVRTAYDGRQGVEMAAEFRPELILMDLGMPVMNGYEAARCIRQQPGGQEVMLVALTGWGQDEDRQRTKDAGFGHHLVKPAGRSDLQRLFAELENRSA